MSHGPLELVAGGKHIPFTNGEFRTSLNEGNYTFNWFVVINAQDARDLAFGQEATVMIFPHVATNVLIVGLMPNDDYTRVDIHLKPTTQSILP